MDFNYLKKRVAVLSAVALATAGMTATVMPAAAAEGDVVLIPKAGTGNTVFATDDFELRTSVKSQLDTSQLAVRIDNPDQTQLAISTGENDMRIFGIKADGSLSEGGSLSYSGDVDMSANPMVVDFDGLDIVSLVVYGLTATSNVKDVSVQLDNNPTAVTGGAAVQAVHPYIHDELTSATSVTVTSWLEESNGPDQDDYKTVDANYRASFEVNFVDPSDVSAIPQIERFDGYNTTNLPNYAVTSVRAAVTADQDTASTTVLDATSSVGGVTLVSGDRILLTNQDTAGGNGIYEVTDTSPTLVDSDLSGLIYVQEGDFAGDVFSATDEDEVNYVRAAAGQNIADTDAVDTTVFGGITAGDVFLLETQTTAGEKGIYVAADTNDLNIVDLNVSGPVFINEGTDSGKIYFGDNADALSLTAPTSSTLRAFNAKDDGWVGASLRFSNGNINLAQVDLTNWDYRLNGDGAGSTGFIPGSTALNLKPATPAGYTAIDGKGKLQFPVPATDAALDAGATYQLSLRHSGDTDVVYNSNGFQVVEAPSSSKTSDTLDISVGTTTDAVIGTTYSSGYPVDVRNGVESLTFTAQLDSDDGTTARGANIPVIAVVTAGSNWTTGETLTVSGSTETIASATGTIITTGLTNSDGQFAVTVTSSDASSASAKYDIQFFVLSSENDAWESDEEDGNSALFKADYASATLAAQPDGFSTSTTVASGSSVTLTFDVEDQWGQPLSAASGKAYSVELQASDDDDLDLDVAVANGTATFTFDNYVTAGGSDVLTAKLYTGSATSPSFVSGRTVNVTLYNTNAIAGINLTNDEFTGENVEYTDFFSGKAAAGQKEPSTSNNYTVQGTVVDSNGAGVPGAPVTISAEGMAFKADGGSSYTVDSIDVIASAAGAFKVDFWTQTYSEDGVELTVTSGDQTATATVEAALADGDLDPGNLRMSWTIDEDSQFVMNTTYAVTATLEDVFGNPVEGAALKFTGLAAAEFNGVTAETRVTGGDGTAVAYLRSIKDVSGLSAVGLELVDNDTVDSQEYTPLVSATIKDDTKTSWDESAFENSLSQEITFLNSAADVVATDQKVNAGSFKGFVAVYAKGHEGARLSAKIGNDWVIVPSLASNFERITDFTGAGVDIAVRIYIDRVLIDTINLTTK